MDGRSRLEIEENEAERGLVSLEKRKPVGVAWRSSKRPRSFPQTRRGLATVLHFRDFQVHGASPREKFFAQIFSKKAALRLVLARSHGQPKLELAYIAEWLDITASGRKNGTTSHLFPAAPTSDIIYTNKPWILSRYSRGE